MTGDALNNGGNSSYCDAAGRSAAPGFEGRALP